MSDDAPEMLPCPFCGWENIRIIEANHPNDLLSGAEYTYCWCKRCGTRGPWAFSVDDDEKSVIVKCIQRWNERSKPISEQTT